MPFKMKLIPVSQQHICEESDGKPSNHVLKTDLIQNPYDLGIHEAGRAGDFPCNNG